MTSGPVRSAYFDRLQADKLATQTLRALAGPPVAEAVLGFVAPEGLVVNGDYFLGELSAPGARRIAVRFSAYEGAPDLTSGLNYSLSIARKHPGESSPTAVVNGSDLFPQFPDPLEMGGVFTISQEFGRFEIEGDRAKIYLRIEGSTTDTWGAGKRARFYFELVAIP